MRRSPYDVLNDPVWGTRTYVDDSRNRTFKDVLGILLRNAQSSHPSQPIDSMMECINRVVLERVYEMINPRLVMTGPVMMLDWSIEARTRRLRSRLETDRYRHANGFADEDIVRTVNDLTDEIRETISEAKSKGYGFCPYALVVSSGKIVDPSTFNPFIAFQTRYGMYELP